MTEEEYVRTLALVEEFYGKSLARKAVTYLTNAILQNGKLAYLYVDKSNPIFNHLYQSIGYEYVTLQMEVLYLPK